MRTSKTKSLATVTAVDAAETYLRDEIFSARLEPGERIREAPLAEELSISRHTLRAAFGRLETVGLLRYRENRGWSVPVFDRDQYEDILILRGGLEATAMGLLVEKGATPDAAVTEALEQLLATTADTAWTVRLERDCALHQAIVDLAGSPRLTKAFATMMYEFRLCRTQSVEWLDALPLDEWKRKHEKLVVSLGSGDTGAWHEGAMAHYRSSPWNVRRASARREEGAAAGGA